MERNFTNENFENFLRRNADGLRMRPNEKVWKEISKKLNRRKRVAGFTIGSVLLAICTLGYFAIEPGKIALPENNDAATASQDAQTQPPAKSENLNGATTGQNSETPVIAMTSSPLASVFNPTSEASTLTGLFSASPDIENQDEIARINAPLLFQPTVTDEYPGVEQANAGAGIKNSEEKQIIEYPLTRESVFNLKPKSAKKKISFQFYFTPTISYRRLSENKTFLRSQNANVQNLASWTDVNSVVTHKPDMGFEMGFTGKYPLTKNLKLRTGVQFSINRYDIKAYNANAAFTTLMLNTRNNGIDSLSALTRYSNFGSAESDWLENFYFQLSAPIGLELILAGNDKVQFGVASTIQPTYVLGGKSYMITTDYKSYTEVPDLTRRFNVNTSLETFIGYSTGRLNWQVGPQLRYQLLSSFDSKYPVKENLFNYGLKIGVSINNNQ